MDNRAELMALAIIGVLVTHLNGLFEATTPAISIMKKGINFLFQSVYVEGFIFLSGMGVFYSLRKNKIGIYYKNRIKRVVLPFMLIGFLFFMILCRGDLLRFLAMLTTAEFWLHGNYYGMWYIAIALFCYLIAPMIYDFVFKSNMAVVAKLTVVLLVIWGIGLTFRILPPPFTIGMII